MHSWGERDSNGPPLHWYHISPRALWSSRSASHEQELSEAVSDPSEAASRTLIEHLALVLAVDADDRVIRAGAVPIAGDRIEDVGWAKPFYAHVGQDDES